MKESGTSEKTSEQRLQEEDMRRFLQNFESKNLTYMELSKIYRKNATSPQFSSSMYSAIAFILLPSITNIYYTYRPHAMFSKVLPVIMPVVCLIQYMGMVKYDLQNYCFKDSDDSETIRKKFDLLNQLQFSSLGINKVKGDIQYFEKSKSEESGSVTENTSSADNLNKGK